AGALTQAIGWRAAFIIPGALCATTGAVLFCCVRGGGVLVAAADRRPEPVASRKDVIRTFIVLSFTMLADGTISQAITVALPKAVCRRTDRPHRGRHPRRRRLCHLGVSGGSDGSAGRRLDGRPLCDEGGLPPRLGGSGPA